MAKRPQRRMAPQRQTRTRTRQNKGALVLDPAQNTKLLSEQLSALGLYAAPTLGDGNCLFRALSDQIYGSPSQHLKLREEICDWIAAQRQRYEPFVDDERGLDVHLQCMRQPGTYGGHLELSAFAHLKRRDVKVIQPGLVYVIEWAAGGDPSAPTSPRSPTLSLPLSPTTSVSVRDARRMKRELKKEKDNAAKYRSEDDDDESDEGSTHPGTVYVAYHDWEHFSSVRNLSGPHVGLPYVLEKPAPSSSSHTDDTPPSSHAKSRHSKPSKKTRSSAIEHIDVDVDDSDVNSSASPTAIPLPMSRSTSPTPSSEASASSVSSSSLSVPPIPEYSSAAASSDTSSRAPDSALPKLYLRINRSPKRSIDESSGASTSQSVGGDISSQGDAKRARNHARVPSDTIIDVDGDTPGFTASSDSSDSSSASSPAPSTPPSMVVVPPTPSVRLTRRQRKLLGLPHPRSQLVAKLNAANARKGNGAAGAGKIVIPAISRKGSSVAVVGKDGRSQDNLDADAEGEWVKNGAGRLDVRGFKELKI